MPEQPRPLYAWSLYALANAVERYELALCEAARDRQALERLYWIQPTIVGNVAPHIAALHRVPTVQTMRRDNP